MSLLRDHITEIVSTFDPADEDAAAAFHAAIDGHFKGVPRGDVQGPLRRAVVEVEVLWSAEDYAPEPEWTDLMFLAAEGLDGSASISASETKRETVNRAAMADLLDAQGSDPEFLGAVCRFPDCDADPDDGEGWDGWCGHHADTIEAHRHPEHGHDPSERTDCAVCAGHAPVPDDE